MGVLGTKPSNYGTCHCLQVGSVRIELCQGTPSRCLLLHNCLLRMWETFVRLVPGVICVMRVENIEFGFLTRRKQVVETGERVSRMRWILSADHESSRYTGQEHSFPCLSFFCGAMGVISSLTCQHRDKGRCN